MTAPHARLTHDVERVAQRTAISALAAVVIEDRAVAASGSFGCDVGPDTVFAVASLSKPVFAHAVLRLSTRGLLDLNTPLIELDPAPYVPDRIDPDAPDLRRITARHVLSHTSGLGNWQGADVGRIGFSPGSRWHYSGDGFLYLQSVVEHLAGSPLEVLGEIEVFRPLNMDSTSFLWTEKRGVRAEGHEFSKAAAAYSLHTTASDYARFVIDAMGSEVGSSMLEPQVAIDGSLVWVLAGGIAGRVFWHWGEMDSFACAAVGSRETGWGLVCLTRGDNGLDACVEILRVSLGDEYSYPISAVLERGW